MKKIYLNMMLCLSVVSFVACSSDTEELMNGSEMGSDIPEMQLKQYFAVPDDAAKLDGTPNENLKALFKAAGSEVMTTLGSVEITDEQYAEIKVFTDSIVQRQNTTIKKYQTIFKWVAENIKYVHSDNTAYAVFKNRRGICQGYSNLLAVMCHTQGIPATLINGMVTTIGGHAWVYVKAGSQWIVSDPTNNAGYAMDNVGPYSHFIPYQADADLFEDDKAIYHYYGMNLNIREVTQTEGNIFTVPYSVAGFVVGSFNPTSPLPDNITEVYIGQNIKSLGENPIGLVNMGKNVEAAHVDEANTTFMSHKGVVYFRTNENPIIHYVPSGMKSVELLPMEVVYKNTIYDLPSVEEVIFPEGTKRLEDYAIENCPHLKRIYVPADCEFSARALYNVPATVEIIRGMPSGIVHVRM
ncbi:MAG: transglutaminase domain-containing protein [Bacteroidaceae bacterium]|nr:transglutaminase domain-containing protein [Bacteroidaceae bacterium]